VTRTPSGSALRLAMVLVLGFASGLPLALTGQAMQAWLTSSGASISTIGTLSLVGLPYTFKFLWAPLLDRFEPAWLGRRRGWLVVTQLLLAASLVAMSSVDPAGATRTFALLAVAVAFASASQDIVIDAYRTDLLQATERGMGSSLSVLGYRFAMILSGGVTLIWTDPAQHGAWDWPGVYRLMAAIMVGAAAISALVLPGVGPARRPDGGGSNDLRGFAAVCAAVGAGYLGTSHLLTPAVHGLHASLTGTPPSDMATRWLDLVALLLGVGVTLPLATRAARVARFETLLSSLANYFAQPGARGFLAFIVLYKLGDAFAGSLMTPFLLKAMAYPPSEVGLVNKVLGIWLTIGGAVLGGALMIRLGLWRSLLLFGVLQMLSNLGFWWLAAGGKGVLPALTIPAFDLGFVHLDHATPVDGGLLGVIAFENLSGGMGTSAFVAFLMSLCSQRFSATQYALLSAFGAIGRVWVGPMTGVLAESIGWPAFFVVSTAAALPAIAMLGWMRTTVQALEVDPESVGAVDD
jgi:PAT family beta-lactamase induction signal transducer AmpG